MGTVIHRTGTNSTFQLDVITTGHVDFHLAAFSNHGRAKITVFNSQAFGKSNFRIGTAVNAIHPGIAVPGMGGRCNPRIIGKSYFTVFLGINTVHNGAVILTAYSDVRLARNLHFAQRIGFYSFNIPSVALSINF